MRCKYYVRWMCHLTEMENCQNIGVPELDGVHKCPFHPVYDNYCFDDAMLNDKALLPRKEE